MVPPLPPHAVSNWIFQKHGTLSGPILFANTFGFLWRRDLTKSVPRRPGQFYHEAISSGVSGLVTRQPSVQGNVALGLMFWRPADGSGEMLSRHIKSGGKWYLVDPATSYGEYSSPSIKCAISAGWDQNGGTFSADLNRLTDEFWILGRKRTGLSIWFLGHARTAVHTIRLLPNGFRDESTEAHAASRK